MTTEEVLRAFWRAFNAHDLDALLSFLEDEVTLHAPAAPEPIVGRARVGAAWNLMFSYIAPDLHKELTWKSVGERSAAFEIIERGSLHLPLSLATRTEQRAIGPHPYELGMAVHFDLSEDGLISRIATYWDTASMARQVGLDVETILDMHRRAIGAAA